MAEYLYDGRDDDGSAPATAFENDAFGGLRLTFNNEWDTNIYGGAVVDLGDGATALAPEAQHRLGAHWGLEAVIRALLWVPDNSPLAAFRNDDFLSLSLTRHF